MKSFSKSMVFGFLILALMPIVGFSQQVIEDDAVVFGLADGLIVDFQLGLSQTTSFNGGPGMGLFEFGISDLGENQFRFEAFGIAEEYALYFAEQGVVVDQNFVSDTDPFAANFNLNDPDAGAAPADLTLGIGESIFFGYFDAAESGNNFGWFELSRSSREDLSFGQLEILGGATSIGSGIRVGSTTAVPEPSTAILIGRLGAVGLICRRRKRTD